MNWTLFAVDIDGCIADARLRYASAGPEPEGSKTSPEYGEWVSTIMNHAQMAQDPEVPGMLALLRALRQKDHVIVLITSREECHRTVTAQWLDRTGFFELADRLVMRPQGSLLPDSELKEQAIDDLVGSYRPQAVVVLDDDLRGGLAKVCERNGWTMLKVQGFSQ